MRLFGLTEAGHYCASFTPEIGDAEGSLDQFRRKYLPSVMMIKEGTQAFNEYRACALRDVERSLFFSASLYRRCLDSLIASASPWAQVTMYYGCWHSARAILGMFGCAVFDRFVVDVKRSHPTAQELSVRRIGTGAGEEPTTYSGPHRRFWDIFYRAVNILRPLAGPALSFALLPVAGDPAWQIDRRNEINYDTHKALDTAVSFDRAFSAAGFPSSLPGSLGTQYGLFESLLEITFTFAAQLSLRTDGLALLSPSTTRSELISKLVYSPRPPSLISKTKKRILVRRVR